jgi:dihydrofolate synthase/folylpolyglutamate synthase
MTYKETLDWLFGQFPAYQKIGKSAYKADLSNIKRLSDHLDNPHLKFKSIHVGGTNGKGSSSHMLSSILQEAGYKVGLYTSPHLKDFRERIKINGKDISEDKVVEYVTENKSFFEAEALSFFEMTVGLAFKTFAVEQVDIAIIEVGLGGRLDATNIISPEVSLITNIGIDHTTFLGSDLVSIAKEKAGIIKFRTPVVISEFQTDTAPVFEVNAAKEKSIITFADKMINDVYDTDLLGSYQSKNYKGVLAVLKHLSGFDIPNDAIVNGLKNVVNNTGLQGRWQILQEEPKVICDTAHNKEGLLLTMAQLQLETYNKLHIVFGVVSDKDLNSILQLLPKNAQYYFCAPNNLRALSVSVLQSEAKKHGCFGECYESVNEAFVMTQRKAFKEDVIYVGGSTFVVAEIL